MENSSGLMDHVSMVNSIRIIFTDMEPIIGQIKDNMLENGEIIKCMGRVFSLGVMAESILYY